MSAQQPPMEMPSGQDYFDQTIGRLDRLLSEFLLLYKGGAIDPANRKTLKHHADDLIGVGERMHELLNPPPASQKGAGDG